MKQTAAAGEKFPQELLEADICERWSSRCELPVQSSVGIKEPLLRQHSERPRSWMENKYLAVFVFTADSEINRKASSRVHFTFYSFQLSLHTDERLQTCTHLFLIKAASRDGLVGPMRSSCSSESRASHADRAAVSSSFHHPEQK